MMKRVARNLVAAAVVICVGCNRGDVLSCPISDSMTSPSDAVFQSELVGLWYTCGSGVERTPSDGGRLPAMILIQSSGIVVGQEDYSRHGPDVFRSRGRIRGTSIEVQTTDIGWRPVYEVRDGQLTTLGSHQPLCHARTLERIS
jgi:hypothetical protein